MAQNEIYRVTMVFTDSVTAQNQTVGLYVKQPNVTGFDVNDIGDAVATWWSSELESSGMTTGQSMAHGATTALAQVELRKWDPISPLIDIYTTGLPEAGTGSGGSLPAENAILCSLRTALSGRRYRGRIYLPAPSEGNVNVEYSLGQETADQLVGLFNLWLGINAGLGAAQPVVYSAGPYKNNTPSSPIGATVITSVKVDQEIRSQRRRNLRSEVYHSAAL